MPTFQDRRALRAARTVATVDLATRLAQSITAAGEEVRRAGSVSEVIGADYETAAITPAGEVAFRDYVVLALASVDRFTAELRTLNARIGATL